MSEVGMACTPHSPYEAQVLFTIAPEIPNHCLDLNTFAVRRLLFHIRMMVHNHKYAVLVVAAVRAPRQCLTLTHEHMWEIKERCHWCVEHETIEFTYDTTCANETKRELAAVTATANTINDNLFNFMLSHCSIKDIHALGTKIGQMKCRFEENIFPTLLLWFALLSDSIGNFTLEKWLKCVATHRRFFRPGD